MTTKTDQATLYVVAGPNDRPAALSQSDHSAGSSAQSQNSASNAENTGSTNNNAIAVQFNPASLKVSLANTLNENDNDNGSSAAQYINKSSSTLKVDLIFDTTDHYFRRDSQRKGNANAQADLNTIDVRLKIKQIAHKFMFSEDVGDENSTPQRCFFIWGTFSFIGIMETLDETLDFFSPEGIPLRATVSIKLTESRFAYQNEAQDPRAAPGKVKPSNGPIDNTVKQSGGSAGSPKSKQPGKAAAFYNGVESPRLPSQDNLTIPNPAAAQDLAASASASLSGGLSASASLGASLGGGIEGGFNAGLGAGFSAGAGVGLSAGASLSADIGLSGGLGVNTSASAGFGASAGLGASASFGASAGISGSAGLNADFSKNISVTPPAFNFGASASLGTSIPGAFSADFENSNEAGLPAGALASGSVSLRAEVNISANGVTSQHQVTRSKNLGFD